ncbi:MAG: isopenicillin N synthase family dioxygenase [Stackebrandtia sp.]
MTQDFVPIIDISSRETAQGRADLAAAIGEACETSGFYTIVGHGVPGTLIEHMYAVTNEFFRLPDEERDRCAIRPGFSGFRDSGGTTARSLDRETPPDLCAAFASHVTGELSDDERERLGDYPATWKLANSWPDRPAEFKDTWQVYQTVMAELAGDLMRLSALALGVDERYFEDKFDRHVSSLVANYYYPQTRKPLPGQLRRGAHTDFGGLTILHQEDNLGGLQVRQGDSWLDIPAVSGSFVVNIGDLMALWTGGRWVSTLHRVVNPEAGNTASRVSIPFFYQPNHDAVVEPLSATDEESGTVVAGEWMATKTAKLFAAAN